MKVWVQHKNGDRSPISLEEKPFASGGEGNLHLIASPDSYHNQVAKVYHRKKRTELRFDKIKYLHEHPPKAFDEAEGITLVWPQELLFDKHDRFIGFIMPLIKGKKLEILTLPKIPTKYQQEWGKYSFNQQEGLEKRLFLCHKIAKAIFHIHQTERYILVDMKPDNIMVNPDGKIALVDLDSVEVIENGETIFDAPVATPEYSPPDSYRDDNKVDPTQEDPWDRFGIAVIFYKLLLGIHPFAATSGAPYDKYTSLYQKIEQGLYVHHPDYRSYLKIIPPLHEGFYSLPISIQKLFNRCFVEGTKDPFARPSSEEWTNILHEYHQHYLFQQEKIELPDIRLQYLPSDMAIERLYRAPATQTISLAPKLQVDKPVTKKELKGHHLPKNVQKPKQIRSQRFFNFIIILLITVVAAALSLLFPWYITASIGFVLYLAFNFATFKTRKSAERKEAIYGVLENQLHHFEQLWEKAQTYEDKIEAFAQKVKDLQKDTTQDFVKDLVFKRQLILEKIDQFHDYVDKRKGLLKGLKRKEKKEFSALIEYYQKAIKEKVDLPQLSVTTPLQMIIQLKRAFRLNELTEEQAKRYPKDLEKLEQLQTQFEIEKAELEHKYTERSKDIIYTIEEAYKEIEEEVRVYHLSVGEEEASKFQVFIEKQRINISNLEQLQYDLRQLQKPLKEQALACRRAKRDAKLYKKINYGRHLLEMVGILRPF